MLKLHNDEGGYYFPPASIQKLEEKYKAKYLGFWTKKGSDLPIDVFYVADPDLEKGHKHYIGFFYHHDVDVVSICDATNCFEQDIEGIVTDDDIVLVSRYRHNFKFIGGFFADGGREYNRFGWPTHIGRNPRFVKVKMIDGEFIFEDINE